jgi:hypothetical protein
MRGFRPNPNFNRELRDHSGTTDALEAAAEAAGRAVQREQHGFVPNKQASSSVEVEVEDGSVRLRNTDRAALVEEYGALRTPALAPLRRGVRAAGLRLDEHGR